MFSALQFFCKFSDSSCDTHRGALGKVRLQKKKKKKKKKKRKTSTVNASAHR